jgi:hypothetical protein
MADLDIASACELFKSAYDAATENFEANPAEAERLMRIEDGQRDTEWSWASFGGHRVYRGVHVEVWWGWFGGRGCWMLWFDNNNTNQPLPSDVGRDDPEAARIMGDKVLWYLTEQAA